MAFAFTASKAYPVEQNSPLRGPFEQILEVALTAANTDSKLDLATLAAADSTYGPAIRSVLSKVSVVSDITCLQSARAIAGAQATGTVTITSYANLVSGTDDTIEVAGVVFTAQAGAATPGDATFQATVSNDATGASLATQINAHATAGALVTAVNATGTVTITSKLYGAPGNAYTLVYTNNDANVGATVSGATLSGGLPTTNVWWLTGTPNAPVLNFPGGGTTPTTLNIVFRFMLYNGVVPVVSGV